MILPFADDRAKDRCKHFMIDQLHNGKYVVVGEPAVHKTLNDLISFHSDKKVSRSSSSRRGSRRSESTEELIVMWNDGKVDDGK